MDDETRTDQQADGNHIAQADQDSTAVVGDANVIGDHNIAIKAEGKAVVATHGAVAGGQVAVKGAVHGGVHIGDKHYYTSSTQDKGGSKIEPFAFDANAHEVRRFLLEQEKARTDGLENLALIEQVGTVALYSFNLFFVKAGREHILEHTQDHELVAEIILNQTRASECIAELHLKSELCVQMVMRYWREFVIDSWLARVATPMPTQVEDQSGHIVLQELEYREKLHALNLEIDPLDTFLALLDEPDNWVKIKRDQYIRHRYKPQFVIKEGETVNEDYREPWTQRFPDSHAQSFAVEYWYESTLLKSSLFVTADGGRFSIPIPELHKTDPEREGWDSIEFRININSLEWKTAMLFDQYDNLWDRLPRIGIKFVEQ